MEPLKFYFAGTSLHSGAVEMWREIGVQRGLVSYYDLIRFEEGKKREYDYFKERDMFLDSGAFSAFNTGVKINLQEYMDFVIKEKIELFANLDVIMDARATLVNQAIMESAGLHPIPCFHIGEEFSYLKDYLENYDYIGLGVAGKQNTIKGRHFLDRCFNMIKDHWPKKIHGYGIMGLKLLQRYPFYSIDSTSPLWTGNVGRIVKWKGRNFLKSHYKDKDKRINRINYIDKDGEKNQLKRQKINYLEYMKYEKYITKLWTSRGVTWNESS